MNKSTTTNIFCGQSEQMIFPRNIYHYTKLDTALEKILPNKSLRLGLLGNTNDPRETKPWDLTDYIQSDSDDDTSNEILHQYVPQIMRIECKMISFATDFRTEISDEEKKQGMIDNYTNIYHGPGYARPRMWAQYAENHKGVCLLLNGYEFDKELRLANDLHNWNGKIFRECITYDFDSLINSIPLPANSFKGIDIKNSVSICRNKKGFVSNSDKKNIAREYILANWRLLFFRKHPDWKTEFEYRWIIHSSDSVEKLVSISNALKMVIVSTDFPKVYVPSLIELCKALSVPAKKLKWENGFPMGEKDWEVLYSP